MKMSAKVINAREVAEQIRRVPEAIEADFTIGLKRCALLVQRESQKVTPVDTGALRNSARTKTEGNGFDMVASVTFHAAYAIIVHEIHATQKKFLENTYRELLPEIKKILIQAMRGKS
tara:strand:- start:19967 stop:20320 length:354 start_codon:yes stop_codon:yes gene_type:complete